MERARRELWSGFGLALAILTFPCLLAPQALADDDTGSWLLNPSDGSEEQVEATLAGAEALLYPPASPQQAPSFTPLVAPPTAGEGYPDLEVPKSPWRYDGEYFFGLSRGVFHEDIPGAFKGLSLLGTVPLDLVGLPFAGLAGFFGT